MTRDQFSLPFRHGIQDEIVIRTRQGNVVCQEVSHVDEAKIKVSKLQGICAKSSFA